MSSRVYFRFSSSTEFDYVPFEGEFITIGELKYLISKKTGVAKDRSTVIELFDSRTEEEYVHTDTMVAKNASVIAKRSPAVRPPPISAPAKPPPPVPKEPAKNPSAPEPEENLDEALGPGVFAPDKTEEADDAAISELVKGFGEVWRTDLNLQSPWRRGRGREMGGRGRRGPLRVGRANLPPPGYVCHRCKTPGHFIDECPTNGDPNFDFVRVRYPTGIPSSMLEKDEQGGLMLPDGQRARLKPNTEKFKQEMEGVPSGEPTMKRLTGTSVAGDALMDQRFEELSNALAKNPLAALTPMMTHVLPHGRDEDIRGGFFSGQPFDRQAFLRCRDEHRRVKAAYEGNSAQPAPNWTPPPHPGPSTYDNGHWSHPPPSEMYREQHWTQKGPPSFAEYGPPRKAQYVEHPSPWHPDIRAPYFEHGFPQPPPYPAERYAPEPPMPYPLPASDSGPSLHSKVVRLDASPPEELRPASSENGRPCVPPLEGKKELPYGFERSVQRMSAEETEPDLERRPTRSRSRSLNKSHRRRSEHRDSPEPSSSLKKSSKTHRRSKEKSHHRRKDRERRGSRRETQDRTSPSPEREPRRHNHQV